MARRIICAFNTGSVLKIRDKFFFVAGPKQVWPHAPSLVKGDNYTLILPPGVPEPAQPETASLVGPETKTHTVPTDPVRPFSSPTPLPLPLREPEEEPEPLVVEPEPEPEPEPEIPSRPTILPGPIPKEVAKPKTSRLVSPQLGQKWRDRDARRPTPFIIANLTDEHVLTDDGRKISRSRMHRYKIVED